MRALALAFLFVTAQAASAAQFIAPDGEIKNLDELLAREALPASENIRVIPLARTARSMTILVQVRDREPLHYHADADITVLVLRGEGALHVGDKAHPVKTGDVMLVPRGAVHAFVNKGPNVGAALVTYSPPPGPNDRVLTK
jgi:quercetin dioxygenase-like cupin family protein